MKDREREQHFYPLSSLETTNARGEVRSFRKKVSSNSTKTKEEGRIMLRASNRPLLAYFDSIKNLRVRQLSLILKSGFDPNLMVNARGQNGLQFMINYFGATDAHFRLQAPINKAAYLSIAKLLLDSGLDPNTVDLLSGETVMFDAVRLNDRDMVSILLNYTDFSLRNKNGETVLMCAARFGSKQVMRMMLEHLRHLEADGYFLRQRNRLGLTALELARVENLDCARVITKHLIAYQHHTGAVLSRSHSHHQLLPARAAYPLPASAYHHHAIRAGPARQSAAAAAAAALYVDDSDLSELELAEVWPPTTGANRVGVSSGRRATAEAAGYFDPKAAEFNQYLLEQQQDLQQQQAQTSDEDADYFGEGVAGGQLTRSRSCILGPTAGSSSGGGAAKQSKYSGANSSGAGKKGAGNETAAKMGSSSWESAGGRSTIA